MTDQNFTMSAGATCAERPFVTTDVTEFEQAVQKIGLQMSATQLSRGEPEITLNHMVLGDAVLASYRSNQELGVHFRVREGSLNFSIQAGRGGAMMDGKKRNEYSLIFYSLPGSGQFSAVVPANPPEQNTPPAIHISLPASAAPSLRLPEGFLEKGWVEIPLDPQMAREFVGWSTQRLAVDVHSTPSAKDQLQLWLARMLSPLRERKGERDLRMPGHYSRIIGLADAIIEAAPPQEPVSIQGIADELRISTRTLQRAFQGIYGTSVSLYVQHRRLERARSLLLTTQRPICHAARHMGFEHASRFAAQYRRLYGNLPSATRRAG